MKFNTDGACKVRHTAGYDGVIRDSNIMDGGVV
ncbi:hypothetical protein A2U01_0076907, partial [Trifolium medium]|nr:hypothetical protein [Trifolium medium]